MIQKVTNIGTFLM